ncbi:MAG: ATP-binding cassette domain-containing protein [Tissierellia bacterium]|nr:ATP-binding cassette domain-containing protein [Tissierellia bacterium]
MYNKYGYEDRIIEIEEIEFKNLNYTYEGSENNTLNNINIKIRKGELIGIVGENGSGKTTFIKLLCGFYDNYQGEILINGIELKKINPDSLRKRMGIIFQDFNKYEMTLR